MSYTKRQFIQAAYRKIGLAAYVFDITPDEMDAAIEDLDTMMATWNGKGIRLAYPLPGSPDYAGLDEITSVPDSANEAVITNLALRLAPAYGKQVAVEVKASARQGYEVLLAARLRRVKCNIPAWAARGLAAPIGLMFPSLLQAAASSANSRSVG